jgi:hypothetical protein
MWSLSKQILVGWYCLAAATLCTPAAAEPGIEEALGLAWGMSLDELLESDANITLDDMCLDENDGRSFLVHGLQAWLPDIAQVIVFLGFDDRLWRISVQGKTILDTSGQGAELLTRYDELRDFLVEHYGEGSAEHYREPWVEERPAEYLGSLQMGNSWHYSQFDADATSVQLGLRAKNVVSGYYQIYAKQLELEAETDAMAQAMRLGEALEVMPELPAECE